MTMTTTHPAARKVWSNLLERSTFQGSFFLDSPMIKRAKAKDAIPADCVIVLMTDLIKGDSGATGGVGWIVNHDLEGPLFGIPFAGDNVITGFNRLAVFTDQIQINQDRFAVQNEGKFADGLVPYDFLDRVRERAANEFWKFYFDERILIKMCGSVGVNAWVTIDPTQPTASARNVNGSAASDGNDLRSPSSARIIFGAGRASAATVTTADGLSLDLVDLAILQAVRPAKSSTLKRIVPTLTINSKDSLVLVADFRAVQFMAANTSGRQYDLARAAVQGGASPATINNWAAYTYLSPMGVTVYIVSHPNMPTFTTYGAGTNLNAARCVLLGRGAMRLAPGRDSKDVGSFSWHEREGDEGNQIVVTTGWTGGVQKSAYNTTETGTTREDYAMVTLDVYVATA